MTDPETRDFYDRAAEDYAQRFAKVGKPDSDLQAFMGLLPAGGHVLDLGCGPGRSAKHMMEAGFRVDAADGSQGMVETARKLGVDAQLMTFDALNASGRYDGVFANFSLLHAPRKDIPAHLTRIHTALRQGGALHLGMKLGTGEARDKLGRFYTYVAQEELESWLTDLGFTLLGQRVFESRGMAGDMEPAIVMRAHA